MIIDTLFKIWDYISDEERSDKIAFSVLAIIFIGMCVYFHKLSKRNLQSVDELKNNSSIATNVNCYYFESNEISESCEKKSHTLARTLYTQTNKNYFFHNFLIQPSRSATFVGMCPDRFLQPFAVTNTSSSIRMPIPRYFAGTVRSSIWK